MSGQRIDPPAALRPARDVAHEISECKGRGDFDHEYRCDFALDAITADRLARPAAPTTKDEPTPPLRFDLATIQADARPPDHQVNVERRVRANWRASDGAWTAGTARSDARDLLAEVDRLRASPGLVSVVDVARWLRLRRDYSAAKMLRENTWRSDLARLDGDKETR